MYNSQQLSDLAQPCIVHYALCILKKRFKVPLRDSTPVLDT